MDGSTLSNVLFLKIIQIKKCYGRIIFFEIIQFIRMTKNNVSSDAEQHIHD